MILVPRQGAERPFFVLTILTYPQLAQSENLSQRFVKRALQRLCLCSK